MSTTHSLNDRVLTLAGVFQAASLVKHSAYHGASIDTAAQSTLNSLFVIEADAVESIYGGIGHLRSGLNTLITQLGGDGGPRDVEISRYVISLLYLEKKLSRQPDMLETLSQGIREAQEQAEYFSTTHENVIAALADLYQRTISTLTPRIMVNGDPACLQEQSNARLIRALLLSGIRSAMAWRQCGGTRWQLLLKRQRLIKQARECLSNLPGIDTRV